jgi:3-phenylpropionate/trans-cinnamate dioxygenase ferredoxin subunit
MAQHLVAKVSDLPVGALQRIVVEGEWICLAHAEDGAFYAIADACTHEGYSLAEGEVLGDEIECPQHSSRFDLRTGQPTALPAVVPAHVYPVSVVGEEVYIQT